MAEEAIRVSGARYIADLPCSGGVLRAIEQGGLVVWLHPDHPPKFFDAAGEVAFGTLFRDTRLSRTEEP